ncbi:MAG: DEAD/DEAH box helicase, partial [Myxococcota bacterium]
MSESPTPSRFDAFALDARIRAAVASLGFEQPTPIQARAIPPLLDGRDVIGGARTGSGKTAAFGLPLLHRLAQGSPRQRKVRGLVLTPTRELALQVTKALQDYGKELPLRVLAVYGGAPYGPQLRALRDGVSLVVGTPGRVLDHLDRGALDLRSVEALVLDEADEMLRMGFIDDVERILLATPEERQIVLFSATMPEPIRRVAVRRMADPVEVQVEAEKLTVSHIEQRWLEVPARYKAEALVRVLRSGPEGATLIFARTRASCADLAELLGKHGVRADALHGDLSQHAREQVLHRLRQGMSTVVVATDVAARGLDVDLLTQVVNFDLPDDTEQYVHRIGRTGRAGRSGAAVSLVTPREGWKVRRLERALGVKLTRAFVPSDAEIADRARKSSSGGASPRSASARSAAVSHSVDGIASSSARRPLR